MKYKIPFIRPIFPSVEEVAEDYKKIVDSNWFSNFGAYEKELSLQAARYIDESVYATTVANCTLGLDIAVAALFNPLKHRVITQSFTFAAGSEVLIRNGFEPVFIDIEHGSWQMSLENAEEAINSDRENIAGILLCNTFGVGNPDITKWEDLSKKYSLPLIIDSAAGFGSKYTTTELIGGRGDCEVFSLHATKPFAVGEGGLVTSRSQGLIDKLRSLQNFGFQGDRTVHQIGMNAKMQELSCAIGLRQLSRLSERISVRQEKLRIYKNNLESYGFVFQINDNLSSIAFVSVLVPPTVDPIHAQAVLDEMGVEARRYYTPAIHLHEAIMQHSTIFGNLSVTEQISDRILSLPLHYNMTNNDITMISNALKEL